MQFCITLRLLLVVSMFAHAGRRLLQELHNLVQHRVHVWAQEDLWPNLRAAGGHLHLADDLTLAQALLQEAGGGRGGGRGGGEDEGPPRPSTLHIRDRVAR